MVFACYGKRHFCNRDVEIVSTHLKGRMDMKKNTRIVYWVVAGLIAVLLLLNVPNENYRIFTEAGLTDSEYVSDALRTRKLALPKGEYRIVISYEAKRDVPIQIRAGFESVKDGVLKRNEGGSYFEAYVSLEEATDLFYFEFPDTLEEELTIYNFEVFSEQPLMFDSVYIAVVFLLLALTYFLMTKYGVISKAKKRTQMVFLLSVGLIIFSSYPLFTGYLVYSHDLSVHLMRIEGVKSAIMDGQLLAVIYPDCNNGHGLLGFVYPNLFLYFPAFLRLMNVSMVTSYQSFLILINAATALVTYFSVKSVTKEDYPALMATILYMLAPYRLCNLYFRGALGEVIAMVFLPLVLAGIYHIFLGEKKKWYLLVLGYTGILQSHMLSCLMVAFLSVGIGIIMVKYIFQDKRYLSLLKAAALFLILNCGYIMALIRFSGKAVGISTILNQDFYEDAVYPGQLLMTKASANYTENLSYGIHDELSLSIGMIGGIAILILILYLMCYQKRSEVNLDCTHIYIVALTCISGALLFCASTLFPWKGLSHIQFVRELLSTIQFSFRFLGIVSVLLAVTCGLAIAKTEMMNRYRRELFLIIFVAGLFGAAQIMDEYAAQEVFVTKSDGGFSDCQLPEYWPAGTKAESFSEVKPWTANIELEDYKKDGTKISFRYTTKGTGQAYVDLPLLYYAGYYAVDSDGAVLSVMAGEQNRVRVLLEETAEAKTVSVKYSLKKSD